MLPAARQLARLPRYYLPLCFSYTLPFFVTDVNSVDTLLDGARWKKELVAFTMLACMTEELRVSASSEHRPPSERHSLACTSGDMDRFLDRWEASNQDLLEDTPEAERALLACWVRDALLFHLDYWRNRVGFPNGAQADEWRSDLLWHIPGNQLGEISVRVVHRKPGGPEYELVFAHDEPIRESALVRLWWVHQRWMYEWEHERQTMSPTAESMSESDTDLYTVY